MDIPAFLQLHAVVCCYSGQKKTQYAGLGKKICVLRIFPLKWKYLFATKSAARGTIFTKGQEVVAMIPLTGADSLIERARRRDTAAFGELYGQVYTDLYRYALYRLGTREEAEDAVQETALEAFKGIGRLQKPDAFRSWIFTILNARCNRHIRGLVRSREETPAGGMFPFHGGFFARTADRLPAAGGYRRPFRRGPAAGAAVGGGRLFRQ